MVHSSDPDSSIDSDKGIRYKTDSIRSKSKKQSHTSKNNGKHSKRRRHNSSSADEGYGRHRSKKDKKHKRDKSREHKSSVKKVKSPSQSPALPTTFKQQDPKYSEEVGEDNINTHQVIGPALPLHLQKTVNEESMGAVKPSHGDGMDPSLHPQFQEITHEDDKSYTHKLGGTNSFNSNKEELMQIIGPTLPNNLQNNIEPQITVIGPALPPHLQKSSTESQNEKSCEKIIGPSLPQHLRQQLSEAHCSSVNENFNEEEDDSYGPLPIGAALSKSHIELEERALQLKIDQLNPQGVAEPTREEWMLELPAVKAANLGLGQRTFRMKAGPDMSDR